MKKTTKKIMLVIAVAAIFASVSATTISATLGGNSRNIEPLNTNCNRIYDVNRDEIINFQDAGLTWIYITTPEIHNKFGDLLYDVNYDDQVNFQDCGLIWINRD